MDENMETVMEDATMKVFFFNSALAQLAIKLGTTGVAVSFSQIS